MIIDWRKIHEEVIIVLSDKVPWFSSYSPLSFKEREAYKLDCDAMILRNLEDPLCCEVVAELLEDSFEFVVVVGNQNLSSLWSL